MARNIYRLGALDAHKSAFLLCDIQEGFRTQIKYFPEVVKVANKMVEAANAFKVPLYISEHYPKAFGPTIKEIDINSAKLVYPKTSFTMYTPELQGRLKDDVPDLKSVVLFGLAAHVCVEQSVIDFLSEDLVVHIIADGVSARSLMDRELALQRLHAMGCFVGTSENVLYKLLKDKHNPAFKVISKLNRSPIPDKFGEVVEQN